MEYKGGGMFNMHTSRTRALHAQSRTRNTHARTQHYRIRGLHIVLEEGRDVRSSGPRRQFLESARAFMQVGEALHEVLAEDLLLCVRGHALHELLPCGGPEMFSIELGI
jgi:hypothetical protein